MKFSNFMKKGIIFTLITAVMSMGIQAPVMAGMVTSEQIVNQSQLEMKRDEVRTFMAREDVRDTLLGYGVDAADVDKRVANMTDAEIQQIHGQIADMPAGEGVLGAILLIIVIFMLLDVAGATDIFPNI